MGEFENMAGSVAEPRYKHLKLTFNPTRIERDCQDLEELVVHELAHALTWRIWEFAEKLIANQTADATHNIWRWFLEEMHEQATTEIGYALVKTKRAEIAASLAE